MGPTSHVQLRLRAATGLGWRSLRAAHLLLVRAWRASRSLSHNYGFCRASFELWKKLEKENGTLNGNRRFTASLGGVEGLFEGVNRGLIRSQCFVLKLIQAQKFRLFGCFGPGP